MLAERKVGFIENTAMRHRRGGGREVTVSLCQKPAAEDDMSVYSARTDERKVGFTEPMRERWVLLRGG